MRGIPLETSRSVDPSEGSGMPGPLVPGRLVVPAGFLPSNLSKVLNVLTQGQLSWSGGNLFGAFGCPWYWNVEIHNRLPWHPMQIVLIQLFGGWRFKQLATEECDIGPATTNKTINHHQTKTCPIIRNTTIIIARVFIIVLALARIYY